MRVLIVNTASLGDIIIALPILDYLKQVSAGIEIDWLVEETFQDILAGQRLLSKVLPVRAVVWQENYLKPSTWRDLMQLKKVLRDRKYDIVFDYQGDSFSGIICWMTGCARCCGFSETEIHSRINARFVTNRIPMRRQDQHISDRMLRVASVPFGKDYNSLSLGADLHSDACDDNEAKLFLATLADGLVFVLHLSASSPTRIWHEAGWIELGQQLTEIFPDLTLLLATDANGDREVAERVAAGIRRQTRILPRQSLCGYVALLKKVDLLIGGDSWPVHLAGAVGTPTVSFYRSTDGKYSAPKGDIHRVLQSPLPCTKCLKTVCEKDAVCRESIQVKDVVAATLEIFA